jgi:hypothetical protein
MPYDNDMNRGVARDINMINKRYISHTDMNGMTNAINYVNPAVEPQGHILAGMGHGERIIGGGVGCADFQRSSASKHYKEDMDEMSGGAILGLQDGTLAGDRSKPISRVRKYKAEGDKDHRKRFGALGDSLPSDIGLSDQNIPAARFQQGYAQKDDSPLETQPESFARAAGLMGTGKSRGRPVRPQCPCGARSNKKCTCPEGHKEGGNGFATGTHMDTGFGTTLGAEDNGGVKSTGLLDLKDTPRKKLRGKGQCKVGGAVLGLVDPPTAGKLDSTISEQKPAPGVTRKTTLKSTPKRIFTRVPEKAQLPSSTLSGLGKKKPTKKAPSTKEEDYESDRPLPDHVKPKRKASEKAVARAQIVKKVMAEHGLSLPAASKYVKEHNLY